MQALRMTVGLISTTLLFSAQAQKVKISDEEIATFTKDVKKKLEKRGDHEAALYSNIANFTFDYFKPDAENKAYASEVSVEENELKTFVALKKNASWSEVLFYNTQSEITKNKVTNHKGMIQPVFPVDKKYNSGDIFHNDVWYRSFNVYAEEEGDRRIIETFKTYYDVKYLVSVYFHEGYYQKEKTIRFEIPKWLTLDIKEINFAGHNITKTSETAKNGNQIITYKMNDLMPVKRDSYSPSFAKSFPHVLVLPLKYTKSGKESNVFSNTQDLYNWYHKLVLEVNNKTEDLKPVVDKLIAGKSTDIDKISSVYYWVQDNIRYIAFEEGLMGFRPESCDNVYKNRYGDCKGMANLLKNMLVLAGYDARLTWIGTTDIPYDYSTPSLGVDNHMICTVFLKDQKIFLDGTESYIGINDYAERIQGRQVLIENGDKFLLEKIPAFDMNRNKIEETIHIKVDGTTLKGKSSLVYNGEMKNTVLRRYHYAEQNERDETMKKFVSRYNTNVKVTALTHSDFEDRTKPTSFTYEYDFTNAVTIAGNEYYINIDHTHLYDDEEIDTLRMDDYEFNNKKFFTSTTTLEVPAGYKVDYVPEALTISHADFTMTVKYEIEGNTVKYFREFKVPNGLIKRKDFKTWNDYIKKLKKLYNDQIVLIKN